MDGLGRGGEGEGGEGPGRGKVGEGGGGQEGGGGLRGTPGVPRMLGLAWAALSIGANTK
jgi:hypothetical protein